MNYPIKLTKLEARLLGEVLQMEEKAMAEHRFGTLTEPRSFREFSFRDIKLVEIWYNEPEDLSFQSEVDLVGIGFQLGGRGISDYPEAKGLSFATNTYNLIYQKGISAQHRFYKDNFHFFNISFKPERFLQLVSSSALLSKKYEEIFATRNFYILRDPAPKISPALWQTMDALRQIDFNNPLADMMAEAFIMSIIVQVHSEDQPANKTNSLATDVKKYLEENYLESLSLKTLAQRFATNEFAIKKEFKEQYQNTIFSYVQQLRMEEAKRRLLEGKTIKEVAYDIGYEHPHHFSTAFRKWYSINPSSLK